MQGTAVRTRQLEVVGSFITQGASHQFHMHKLARMQTRQSLPSKSGVVCRQEAAGLRRSSTL